MLSENLDVLVHGLLTLAYASTEIGSVDRRRQNLVQETTIERTVKRFEEQRDLSRVSVPPGKIRAWRRIDSKLVTITSRSSPTRTTR